jgi:hypothetical protein
MSSSSLSPSSKSEFLESKHVKKFIEFLKSYVDGKEKFEHGYKNRGSKKPWACDSIFDAYEKYSYPIAKQFREKNEDDYESFDANKVVLDSLQAKLKSAKLGDDLLSASIKVLEWGGVAGAKKEDAQKSGNRLWLTRNYEHGKGLLEAYGKARDIFLADSPNLEGVGRTGTRSNAGFTKIYSLMFNDFVIYDSRVAAALGLFVVRYCQKNGLKGIPSELNFGWMDAKEAKEPKDPKRRNATADSLKFSKASSEHQHASANIRTNWILQEVLKEENESTAGKEGFAKLPKEEKLRALEAAFFMIGYDLGSHPWLSSNPTNPMTDYADREIQLKTIANGKPFKAKDVGIGYRLIVGQSASKLFLPKAKIDEMAQEFAGIDLAIGASRTNRPEGSLGEILMHGVSPTAMASYVAPLLVYLGLAVKKDRHTITVLDAD